MLLLIGAGRTFWARSRNGARSGKARSTGVLGALCLEKALAARSGAIAVPVSPNFFNERGVLFSSILGAGCSTCWGRAVGRACISGIVPSGLDFFDWLAAPVLLSSSSCPVLVLWLPFVLLLPSSWRCRADLERSVSALSALGARSLPIQFCRKLLKHFWVCASALQARSWSLLA